MFDSFSLSGVAKKSKKRGAGGRKLQKPSKESFSVTKQHLSFFYQNTKPP